VNGDVANEPDETFTVNLSNPTGATIADGQGLGTIGNDDGGGQAVVFNPIDDAHVKSTSTTSNFDPSATLRIKNSSSEVFNAYLKFNVTGLAGGVQNARLRLYVDDPSRSGGSVYTVSNNYQGTSTPWKESLLTWDSAPAISGTALNSIREVVLNSWVEWEVTPAVSGNGTYSFAVMNAASDLVWYSSKEGAHPPELVIRTGTGSPGF